MRMSIGFGAAVAAATLAGIGLNGARAEGPAASPQRVVYLQRSAEFGVASPKVAELMFFEPLLREMHRQALLVAARDELGLMTRDAWLGDWMPADGTDQPLEIDLPLGKSPTLEVRRGFYPAAGRVAQHGLRVQFTPLETLGAPISIDLVDCRQWLIEAEGFSRTFYVEALRKAGFEGKAIAARGDAAVPEEIDKLLDEMAFTAQFDAVRQLHELLRTDGESPARLGALARGYANLGFLTEFHWHPAHKVFKARALVYAQRMAARDNSSPRALWHRAYAFAAASLHGLAVKDLESADKAWKQAPADKRAERPAWVELIDAHCRYDLDRLSDRTAEERYLQLTGLLRHLTVELSGDKSMAVATGIEAVKTLPECYRIHDGVCAYGGVISGHGATTEWLQVAGKTLYPRLAAMPGLPEAAADIAPGPLSDSPWQFSADEFETRAKLVRALSDSSKPEAATKGADGSPAAAADAGEPSWAALGSLVRELSFVQVWRRVNFECHTISVSTEDFLKTAAPLFADHPYAAFIETFTLDQQASAAAWKKLQIAHPEELELQAFTMCQPFYTVHHPKESRLFDDLVNRRRQYTARDLSMLLRVIKNGPDAVFVTLALLTVSPWSPHAMSFAIEGNQPVFRGRYAAWEKQAPKFPNMCKALARRYDDDDREDDAVKWAKAALTFGPDLEISKLLANCYWYQDKKDLWRTTLEEVLDQPDYELAHGRVCEILARHYMAEKNWEKAATYADVAAETGSAWGMNVGAECYEGLQRWKEAERMIRTVYERYPTYNNSGTAWYFFCRRTGHGDLAAAKKMAEQYIASSKQPNLEDIAEFYLLEKKYQKALEIYGERYKTLGWPIRAAFLVVIYDELKDAKARDKALHDVIAEIGKLKSSDDKELYAGMADLTKLILADVAAGGKGNIDLAAADKALAAVTANVADAPVKYDGETGACAYMLGKYLSLRGKNEAAIEYWKLAVSETSAFTYHCRDLAGAELCQRGIRPDSYKSLWQKKDAGK